MQAIALIGRHAASLIRRIGLAAVLLALPAAWLPSLAAWRPPMAVAPDVLPVPALTARVIDQTGTLSADQRRQLEERLAHLEREVGSQLVILLVPTTAPEDIAAYAQRVGEQWKLGRRDVGDGLLVVVARNDRRVRIEVAKALEGAIPDLAAQRVIDRALVPALRAGDFAGGLQAAVSELAALLRQEYLPAPVLDFGNWSLPTPPGRPDFDPEQQAEALVKLLFLSGPVLSVVMILTRNCRFRALVTGATAIAMAGLFGRSLVWAAVAALMVAAVALLAIVSAGLTRLISRLARRYGWQQVPTGRPNSFRWSSDGSSSFSHDSGGGSSSSSSSNGGGSGFRSGGGGDFGGGGASGKW